MLYLPNQTHHESPLYEHEHIGHQISKIDTKMTCNYDPLKFVKMKVPGSKPLVGSKLNSAFHRSEVDQMSTRSSWGLSGKK